MFGNPETTTGGNALKFYSSIRIDIRKTTQIKDGQDAIGNLTKIKVVKNKVAPPFKQADVDIIYGEGISRTGDVLDLGVTQGMVDKSGAWYTYQDERIGQGRENAKKFLKEHPETLERASNTSCDWPWACRLTKSDPPPSNPLPILSFFRAAAPANGCGRPRSFIPFAHIDDRRRSRCAYMPCSMYLLRDWAISASGSPIGACPEPDPPLCGGAAAPRWTDFDRLVIMGGPMNIYEDDCYPWLVAERALIGRGQVRANQRSASAWGRSCWPMPWARRSLPARTRRSAGGRSA